MKEKFNPKLQGFFISSTIKIKNFYILILYLIFSLLTELEENKRKLKRYIEKEIYRDIIICIKSINF
ncbi:hypothetical protein BpHYR1_027989 [Brachionus plicatilis]|uniref:Uncharacterized protein n=1 Tax=Brachionus plicatilis TaxID=10195 RepID=A0A3M7SA48_BRAPC|nr:hypothetical protein BpHYR1_027989 [Brachionus plicatilis]